MIQGRVHFIGICGTGMGAFAGLLKAKGFQVQGSDTDFYPPMGPFLKGLGIRLFKGFSPKNLFPRPDLVVIGNVVRRDNPEAQAVLKEAIPFSSFPDALKRFCLDQREVICVSGTHGKTTTAQLTISALRKRCPGFLVGGILKEFGKGFDLGKPPWFVVEGDEYDTAFFDKTPKFLHYAPRHAILTGIEFDHADIYKDINEIKSAFSELMSIIPRDGVVAVCADSKDAMDCTRALNARLITYGTSDKALYRLMDVRVEGPLTRFAIKTQKQTMDVAMRLFGRHNALNATGVVALLSELGIPFPEIAEGLWKAQGVKRRQEIVAESGGITVVDDFAHHPTAVRETLGALRARFGEDVRLVTCFEPRTNTSRRAIFQSAYAEALSGADVVFVRDVPNPEKAPENDRFSSKRLVRDLGARGVQAFFCENGVEICDRLAGMLRPGDVVVVLSNGSFDGLVSRVKGIVREGE